MQWWVEQTNGNGQSIHGFKDTFKVFALDGQQFGQSDTATGFIVSQNHFAHGHNFITAKEHVFCAAETNPFGTKATSNSGVVRGVGIGSYVHS